MAGGMTKSGMTEFTRALNQSQGRNLDLLDEDMDPWMRTARYLREKARFAKWDRAPQGRPRGGPSPARSEPVIGMGYRLRHRRVRSLPPCGSLGVVGPVVVLLNLYSSRLVPRITYYLTEAEARNMASQPEVKP